MKLQKYARPDRENTHTTTETYEQYCKRVKASGIEPVRRQLWETVIRDGRMLQL